MATTSLLQEKKPKGAEGQELPPATPEALHHIIEEIGFGRFQVLALLGTGGILASEGAEVLIMGSVSTLLGRAWGIHDFIKGFMVSVVFIGFAFGNLVSGGVGDWLGRRRAILLSYVLIGCMGLVTSIVSSPETMIIFRFWVGFGCGIGFPSVYTIVPEVCPIYIRGILSALMIGFMPLGELYAAIGVIVIDPNLDGINKNSWRLLIQWSAIPSFMFLLFAYVFLAESPHYLLSKGRIQELNEMLATMARMNGKSHVQTTLGPKPPGGEAREVMVSEAQGPNEELPSEDASKALLAWVTGLARPFNSQYIKTTLVMFMAHFTKDFSVFGGSYLFPQYFREMVGVLPVGIEMVILSTLAFPGVLLAIFICLVEDIGYISSLSTMSGLCAVFCSGLLTVFPVAAHSISAYAVKFLALTCFILTVVYTAEVFPTSVRNTAVGLCVSVGRIGSVSAPLVVEYSSRIMPGFDFFWVVLMSCFFTVSLSTRCLLSIETKGKPLIDDGAVKKLAGSVSDTTGSTGYGSTATSESAPEA